MPGRSNTLILPACLSDAPDLTAAKHWSQQAAETFAMGAATEAQIFISRFSELESAAPERLVHVRGRHGKGAIVVGDWHPHVQHRPKSLRGFFTVTLFNGLEIRRLELHERGGKRYVRLPRREWIDLHGRKEFVRVVEFVNNTAARHFREDVLAAFDEHLGEKAK
jgi:hypothetical protein